MLNNSSGSGSGSDSGYAHVGDSESGPRSNTLAYHDENFCLVSMANYFNRTGKFMLAVSAIVTLGLSCTANSGKQLEERQWGANLLYNDSLLNSGADVKVTENAAHLDFLEVLFTGLSLLSGPCYFHINFVDRAPYVQSITGSNCISHCISKGFLHESDSDYDSRRDAFFTSSAALKGLMFFAFVIAIKRIASVLNEHQSRRVLFDAVHGLTSDNVTQRFQAMLDATISNQPDVGGLDTAAAVFSILSFGFGIILRVTADSLVRKLSEDIGSSAGSREHTMLPPPSADPANDASPPDYGSVDSAHNSSSP